MFPSSDTLALADRLPKLVGAPANAAEILSRLRVLMIGGGSVGSRVASHLARWQVTRIAIADPSNFKPQSVLTHDIGLEAIGQPKAEWSADICHRVSPTTDVAAHVARIQDLPPSAFVGFDLAVLASDNLRAETAAGQLCQWLGLPLVQGSVAGETLSAEVRFFGNSNADSPCPGCQFSDDEWRYHDDELVYACNGGPATQKIQPTMSTSFLCSIAADLVMTQIMRHVLGLGQPVADTLLSWCGYTHRAFISPLARRTTCRLEHTRWEQAVVSKPLAECSPAELLVAAGMDEPAMAELVTLGVEKHRFAERAWCCNHEQAIDRFVPAGKTSVVACQHCGEPLVPSPFFLRPDVPLAKISVSAALRKSGVSSTSGIRLTAGSRTAIVTRQKGMQ